MSQVGRPVADEDNTQNWARDTGATTDLYTAIDEAVLDVTDFIISPSLVAPGTYPIVHSADHSEDHA